MVKVKVSATIDPDRLEQAKKITGSDNISEVLDLGLQALIVCEQEAIYVAGYTRLPQGDETSAVADPRLWAGLPWDEE
jgi:hypothetical protein